MNHLTSLALIIYLVSSVFSKINNAFLFDMNLINERCFNFKCNDLYK